MVIIQYYKYSSKELITLPLHMLKDFFRINKFYSEKNEKDQYDEEEIDEKSKYILGMTTLE